MFNASDLHAALQRMQTATNTAAERGRTSKKPKTVVQGDQSNSAEVHTSPWSNTANRERAATAAAASLALPNMAQEKRNDATTPSNG